MIIAKLLLFYTYYKRNAYQIDLCIHTAIWMYPKTEEYGGWPQSGHMNLMESRGNRDYSNMGVGFLSTALHWGTHNLNKVDMTSEDTNAINQHLADGFHNYTFDWNPAGMR